MPDDPVILVTGSSGLIGSAVIGELAGRFRIAGLDRVTPPHPPPQAECICIDLALDDGLRDGFARVRYAYGERIESVVHLAAYYDFSGEPSDQYEQITIRGTQRLLRHLRDFDVGQFIFSSTMLVHAPCQPGERIDEQWPIEPKWDYPKSKIEAERVIRQERPAAGDIPTVVLRIAGVYTDRCQSIPLAHQIQRIFEHKMIGRVFPGDISHGQAFVHLDDVVTAIRLAIDRRDHLPPETEMLIGEDQTLSYDELQRTISRLIHGEEWETTQIPKALARTGAWIQDVLPGEEPFIKPWMIDLADDHYELDIQRAQRLLGWRLEHSLRQTLPTMVAALLADPLEFYRDNKLEPPGWLVQARESQPEAPSAVTTTQSITSRPIQESRSMNTITASQLRRMIDGDESFELINVLPEAAFREEHIPGSMNLPVDDEHFVRQVQDLAGVRGDMDHTIVVYCANPRCTASSEAAQALESAGFTNVFRFEGGMEEWKAAGYPVESGSVRA